MVSKIEKLTPEQEAKLPEFRQEALDIALGGKRIERDKLETAISDAYAVIGKKKPLVIILQSPFQANMAINFMRAFAKSEMGDDIESQLRSQLGSQLGSQLDSQLDSQLGSQLESQLESRIVTGKRTL